MNELKLIETNLLKTNIDNLENKIANISLGLINSYVNRTGNDFNLSQEAFVKKYSYVYGLPKLKKHLLILQEELNLRK